MTRKKLARILIASAVLTCSTTAMADEVIFNNGDHLTGTIEQLAGGKLSIKSAQAGDVTVDLSNVKTFSTDQPIAIKLLDGTVLHQKVLKDVEGSIETAGGGGLVPQRITFKQIDAINPPPVKWTGTLTLSGALASGNSESQALNFAANATRRTDKDRIIASAGYTYARQKDQTTGVKSTSSDNWFIAGTYDYFFTKKFYGYVNGRIERDRIADLDIRVTPGVGVGYQWVERPDLNFNTEAGVTWVYEDYTNAPSDDHMALRFAYHLDHQFNDVVSMFHNLEYLPGLNRIDDFNLNVDVGVRANMNKNLFSQIKLQWQYDSIPAPGSRKYDLQLLAGVGLNF